MQNNHPRLIKWLLEGDIAIQYQVHKKLLETDSSVLFDLKQRMHQEGYGKKYLELRNPYTFKWGNGIYSPKWISTHYTLLELKNMGIDSSIKEYQESVQLLLEKLWFNQGQVTSYRHQDMCVVAMLLSMCAYGNLQNQKMNEMIDYILNHQFSDGGWNCMWESDKNPKHSSLHTTLSVLEAFHDLKLNGIFHSKEHIESAVTKGQDFILRKHLFKSEHTHEIIHPSFLNFPYPPRWKYDILRAMEYFASVKYPYDQRMEEAITIIKNKMKKDRTWGLGSAHVGLRHFKLEQKASSRWNTLRALYVLKMYEKVLFDQLIQQ
jgi:hypothetical protein